MKNLLKVFLMCFITLFAFAGQMMGQQKTITGRVVDALNVCEAGSCCGKPNKTEHSNER